MCGFTGIWKFHGGRIDVESLERATARIRHRGPNDEGYLFANSLGNCVIQGGGDDTVRDLSLQDISTFRNREFDLGFGHRRLSILDLSSAGHQPMSAQAGSLWLLHNGEIYNYVEIREELENLGFHFRSDTDTEVILASYMAWGTQCVRKFNGMWAFVLWDRTAGRLFCSRDQFGIKPLYYCHDQEGFAFASEIKAILEYREVPRVPNWTMVSDFLLYQITEHPQETFFDKVFSLAPGHNLLVDSTGMTLQKYWDLPTNVIPNRRLNSNDIESFRALLTDSIKLRLRSDVPIGTCMSGGLDSTSIAVLINELTQSNLSINLRTVGSSQQKTYSSCYADERVDERKYISSVTQLISADAKYIFPTAEGLLDDVRTLVWHQEMPFPSTSIYAQFCVMKAVHDDSTVVLQNGQGADEVLCGYGAYVGPHLIDLLKQGCLGKALSEYRAFSGQSADRGAVNLSEIGKSLSPKWLKKIFRSIQSSKLPDFVNPELGRLARRDQSSNLHSFPSHLKSSQHTSLFKAGLQSLLRYEDRNSMAFSIESRLPFLDPRIVEFIFSLPAEARLNGGWTKAILRTAMRDRLPDDVRLRTDKMGFPTPEQQWLTHNKGSLVKGVLSQRAIQRHNVLCWQGVQRRTSRLREGMSISEQRILWRCLSVEMWLDQFFDRGIQFHG